MSSPFLSLSLSLFCLFVSCPTITFTQEEWARRDAAVDEAKQAGDPRQVASALLRAHRFDACYEAIVAVTQRDDAAALDWAMRGYIASVASKPDDVYTSFERAQLMDAGVWVPHYATMHNPATQHLEGQGKRIQLRHLSRDCHGLLKKAGHLMVDSDDDPDYALAVNYQVRTGILGGH